MEEIIEGKVEKKISRRKFIVSHNGNKYLTVFGRNFFDYLPLQLNDLVFICKHSKDTYVILTKTDFKKRGLDWDKWTDNHKPKERMF